VSFLRCLAEEQTEGTVLEAALMSTGGRPKLCTSGDVRSLVLGKIHPGLGRLFAFVREQHLEDNNLTNGSANNDT